MQTSRYSAPQAAGPLDAVVSLPGSKSLTNRELVLSALAEGPGLIRAPLHSRDSSLMIEALRALGTGIVEVPGDGRYGPDLRVTPTSLRGGVSIDCGLAGTVMRFLPPVAALARGAVTFDGDDNARHRPMSVTIEALRGLGVSVDDAGTGHLPFIVQGAGQVRGGALSIDASSSSQFVSGLLLVAARFTEGLRLTHTGDRLPSVPHIDMTVHSLGQRGVNVQRPSAREWLVRPGPIAARTVDIEPDLSNAAPFLIAALIAGGTVAVPGWPTQSTQVGAELETMLPLFGATVRRDGDRLIVDGGAGHRGGGGFPGVDLDLGRAGELAPAIVALTALADSASTITGIAHLRGHETDRLAALAAEINALGGCITETDDGLIIEPRPLAATDRPWQSYADHRMAMAGAIIGLAVPGLVINDIGTTAKTLPQFPELWTALVGV
ncbi:MAG: 3-phosphoshikimate 1-carboxyvinyltransferase [Microbacteriaceae bacterium]